MTWKVDASSEFQSNVDASYAEVVITTNPKNEYLHYTQIVLHLTNGRWRVIGNGTKEACANVSSRAVRADLLLKCSQDKTKPGPGAPSYKLPEDVEASFQENGIRDKYGREEILSIVCVGEGYPGPSRVDRFGVSEPTYHLFTCLFTTPRVQAGEMHVESLARSYRYTIFLQI